MAPKSGKKGNKVTGAGQVAARPAAPDAEEEKPKSYLDSLTPEEQEAELKKQAKREEKAAAQQRQQQHEVWKREQDQQYWKKQELAAKKNEQKEKKALDMLLQRANAEGVLEALWGDDDQYWVEVGKDTWRNVPDQYWCPHCEASLNYSVLESHLNGERHRKKAPLASQTQTSWSAAAAPASSSAAWQAWGGPDPSKLQDWQALDPAGGVQCTLCNKLCDGLHEQSQGHLKRLEAHEWQKQAASRDYPPPAQPWLAWVPEESFGNGKYLKCLLCDKWVQDFEAGPDFNTTSYKGNHGSENQAANQKDHFKKISWWKDYEPSIRELRVKYHPPATRGPAAPAPAASRPAASAPSAWGPSASGPAASAPTARPSAASAPAASAPAAPSPPEFLPVGWKAEWSEENNAYYYYHKKTRTTQWEVPGDEGDAEEVAC